MTNLAERAKDEKNGSKKRKRKSSPYHSIRREEANTPRKLSSQKAPISKDNDEETPTAPSSNYPQCVDWSHLDFVLSLQTKHLDPQKKIKLASDFIAACCSDEGRGKCHHVESIRTLRLVPFLSNWVQSLLISGGKKFPSSEQGEFNPCLDHRLWDVFKFCLKQPASLQLSFSPHLLHAVSRVIGHSLLFSGGSLYLFEVVIQCLFLMFSLYGRSFNANIDVWVSAAEAALSLITKIFKERHFDAESNVGLVLLRLSVSVLDPFANYLRVHPSPKNVFPVVVDRLLEHLLAVLVSFDGQVKARNDNLLKILEEVLLNGLFHQAHVDGFLCSQGSEKRAARSDNCRGDVKESKKEIKSYHKHLFWRFERLAADNKLSELEGLGHLLLLFIRRVKKLKGTATLSLGTKKVEKKAVGLCSEPADARAKAEISVGKCNSNLERSLSLIELDEEVNKSVFDIFVLFMDPLLLGLKRYSKIRWVSVSDCCITMISDVQSTIRSINKLLSSFMHEKIYGWTKDASGAHLDFLKGVYDIIISFPSQIDVLWKTALKRDQDKRAEMLLLVAKEVMVSISYFLEIEYKVIGNDLVSLWLLMLSFMAIDLCLGETQCLASEVVDLGCQLVNVYSELRQVNDPIFALCKAVRHLGLMPASEDEIDCSRFVSCITKIIPAACVKSLEMLVSSQAFRFAVSTAINAIPEGQASGCILQLNVDVADTLKWMTSGHLVVVGEELAQGDVINTSALELTLLAELSGKGLSEIYKLILASLVVTGGNSIHVGNSTKDLITVVEPCLIGLVKNQSDSVEDFLVVVTGRKFSEMTKCKSSLPWFFVFFFCIFISCRSLYQKSTSQMPDGSARKASMAIGDLFTTFAQKDWSQRTDWMNGGYFSWIAKPSTSLLTIIQSISDLFLQDNRAGKAPVIYVMHTMVFDRLVDLDRQIRAFKFILRGGARLVDERLMDAADLDLSHKRNRKLERHIAVLEQEAKDLTSYLTGYLPSMDEKGCSFEDTMAGMRQAVLFTDDTNALDIAICSVDEKLLPTVTWWQLSQKIDIWCPYASKKSLNKFLSLLIYHSLSSMTVSDNRAEQTLKGPCHQRKVTYCTSLNVLTRTIFAEQKILWVYLSSRLCCILKKSLSSLICHSSSSVDFNLVPDWSRVLTELKESLALGVKYTHDHSDTAAMALDSLPCNLLNQRPQLEREFCPLNSTELNICQNLLKFLCLTPKICKSSSSLAKIIVNIESLVVPRLLDYKSELFLNNHYELLQLFILCRRACRFLLLASNEENMEGRSSLLISMLFENSSFVVWLFESVSVVVGLLLAHFKEENGGLVKDIFLLMDETSHLFLMLSASKMNAALLPLVHESEGHERDIVTEAGLPSDMATYFSFLLDEIKNLLIDLKETVHNSNLGDFPGTINWIKLSSVISCCQGFLWGVASALTNVDVKSQYRRRRIHHVFEHDLRIDLFEEFVMFCLNMLVVHGSRESTVASNAQFDCINKVLSSETILGTAVQTHRGEIENSFRNDQEAELMDCKDGSLDFDDDIRCPISNIAKTVRSSKKLSLLANGVMNALTQPQEIDYFESKLLNKSLFRCLLKGERPEVSIALRHLFFASSAILKLKFVFSSSLTNMQTGYCQSISSSTVILIGISHFVLMEFGEMVERPHPFSFIWLEGIIKYLEVLGDYFPSRDPALTRNVYAKLIDIHLRAIGKCILLQGKQATLASHETQSRTKTLQSREGSSDIQLLSLCHEKHCLNDFKSRLRNSFKILIRKALGLHLLSAVEAIERALVGVQDGCHVTYEINAGDADGGMVSSIVAAGIDCLDMILEFVSGGKRSNVVKRHMQSLLCDLFNIVLHLQGPLIFLQGNFNNDKVETNPDPGSVVLMCVDMLSKVAGRHSLLQMDPSHVGQSLHLPTILFKHFLQLRDLPKTSHPLEFTTREKVKYGILVDRHFSVELYTACCNMLCAVLRHRKSESERCIGLLEDSVSTLLHCLEMVDATLASRDDLVVWELKEGIKCASILRRIYEEIRQQKDILGKYSLHFLSNYIWILSGLGPLRAGIKREIDEALRPGIYALIDVCSPADLQELHTVLGEGSCRRTLSILQHDYKLNFQYEGKV